jgi:NitT/TauT family transport system permease protein
MVWQLLSIVYATPLFPGPYDVAIALGKNITAILSQMGYTLMRGAAGFLLAAVITIPLGVFLGRFSAIGKIFEPIMDMVASLPPPAVVPLVMLFAGTGDWAKVVVICYAASVPLLMNTYEASRTIHPMLSRVARSLHLSKFETMHLIDFPSSLPMIVTGARMAVASSFLVSITSEILLSTNGIGVYLQRKQELFQIGAGLAGVLIISIIGLLINMLLERLERRWLFWHYRSVK